MTLKPQFYFSPDSGEHFTYLDHSQKMRTDDKSALENPPPQKKMCVLTVYSYGDSL